MANRSKQLSEHLFVFFNDIRPAEPPLYSIITSDEAFDPAAFTRNESSKIELSTGHKASNTLISFSACPVSLTCKIASFLSLKEI